MSVLLWFRRDLRLDDHPALRAALESGQQVIPVYIHSPEDEGEAAYGAASRWWLHHSLAALSTALTALGSRLILRHGAAEDEILRLVRESKASSVYWNRRYEPSVIERDKGIKAKLKAMGCEAHSFKASLLHEPWEVATKEGRPYQVFSPFWRACQAQHASGPEKPLAKPKNWSQGAGEEPLRLASLQLSSLGLLPKISWDGGLGERWQPGEEQAWQRLRRFASDAIADYPAQRDVPSVRGTSTLSPYLAFGEISPRRVWQYLQAEINGSEASQPSLGKSAFVRQLGWREFSYHLLYHFPKTVTSPLRPSFSLFPWQENKAALAAWQQGLTGFPIVDAGMRELWHTGWMHNRVRMIVGSFLVKDLRIHWLEGAQWFWDTLVDADLANNIMGWQWIAGSGADAAPYFRVYNPTTQGEKFDALGHYVRKWVPELSRLPDKWLQEPAKAPKHVLQEAGIRLDREYPAPIVEHSAAREAALQAYAQTKLYRA